MYRLRSNSYFNGVSLGLISTNARFCDKSTKIFACIGQAHSDTVNLCIHDIVDMYPDNMNVQDRAQSK